MKNVRPCPYCGGEVEVVRMPDLKGQKTYRISCIKCCALVARGQGFPIETISEAEDRIKDYEAVLKEQFNRVGSTRWTQSIAAKERDEKAKYSSREDPENEFEY